MKNILVLAVLAVWLAPAGAGFIDIAAWFFFNHAVTGLDWMAHSSLRVLMVLAWTVIGAFPVCAILEV
jgi:hypothetical protein